MDAQAHLRRAMACRQNQDMEAALDAIMQAFALAPHDPHIAIANAHLHFETWRPASAHFQHAHTLMPDNLDLVRGLAMALAAESEAQAAHDLLEDHVAQHQDWIDGHKALSNLRMNNGADDFAISFEQACAAQPDNLSLRLAWFHHMALARDWDGVAAILGGAKHQFGEHRALKLAEIFYVSESGAGEVSAESFAPYADLRDPGLDLCQVRFALRTGLIAQARDTAMRHIGTAAERTFWPYLSIAWRLLNDPRAHWLDGDPPMIESYDLDFSCAKLSELGDILRELHQNSGNYLEQSVRGGTQTDRQIFFHPDPAIQSAKANINHAVRRYIDGLSECDAAHPLLGPNRAKQHFGGSWSVRLHAQGYHSNHTHNRGWISSAFYVALPDPDAMGDAPAGWIAFGTPPPELGLALKPYKVIEPKPARLVLFPSTMWHGTMPFADGERMTMAFDVVPAP